MNLHERIDKVVGELYPLSPQQANLKHLLQKNMLNPYHRLGQEETIKRIFKVVDEHLIDAGPKDKGTLFHKLYHEFVVEAKKDFYKNMYGKMNFKISGDEEATCLDPTKLLLTRKETEKLAAESRDAYVLDQAMGGFPFRHCSLPRYAQMSPQDQQKERERVETVFRRLQDDFVIVRKFVPRTPNDADLHKKLAQQQAELALNEVKIKNLLCRVSTLEACNNNQSAVILQQDDKLKAIGAALHGP